MLIELKDLFGLLTNDFTDLDHIKPSLHPSDYALDRVRVIPFELGALIANADKDETLFHIEFFQHPPAHADLWTMRSWVGSVTRRLKYSPPVSTEATPVVLALQLETTLTARFMQEGLSMANAKAAANCLIRGASLGEWVKILPLTAENLSAIEHIRKLLQQLQNE